MPVRKYRSVADMPAVRPLPPLASGNLEIACELSELTFALHPWSLEPGVRKYRSVEEASRSQRQRDRRQARQRTD